MTDHFVSRGFVGKRHQSGAVNRVPPGQHTVTDVINGQAFVAYRYDGKPLAPEHGGPARLVVPHPMLCSP